MKELTPAATGKLLQMHSERIAADTPFTTETTHKIHAALGGHPATLLLLPGLLQTVDLPTRLAADSVRDAQKIYITTWRVLPASVRELLVALCFAGSGGATASFLTATAELSPDRLSIALRELHRHNLIEVRGTVLQKQYALHSLTRRFILNTVSHHRQWQETITHFAGNAYQHLLAAFAQSQEPDEAFALLIPSLEMVVPSSERLHKLRADLLITAFPAFRERGLLNGWEQHLQRALDEESAEPTPTSIKLWNLLGEQRRIFGRYHTALQAHQTAEAISKSLNAPHLLAETHRYLAQTLYLQQEYARAARYCDEAFESFSQLEPNSKNQIALISLRGEIAAAMGAPDLAETYLKQAVELCHTTVSPHQLIRAFYNLGRFYQRIERQAEALTAFRRARQLLKRFPNPTLATRIALTAGTMHFATGQFEEARAHFETINLDYLRDSHSHELLGRMLNSLANALLALGKTTAAESAVVESVQIFRRQENLFELANTLDTLGDVYETQHRLTEARDCRLEAIALLSLLLHERHSERLLTTIQRKLSHRPTVGETIAAIG